MDRDERQRDGERREPGGPLGRYEDDQHEAGGHHDLEDERADVGDAGTRLGHAGRDGRLAHHDEDDGRSGDRPDDLRQDVADGVGRLDPLVQHSRDRDGRVEVAARDVADREDRRQEAEAEREGHHEQARDIRNARAPRPTNTRSSGTGTCRPARPGTCGFPLSLHVASLPCGSGLGEIDATRSVQPLTVR